MTTMGNPDISGNYYLREVRAPQAQASWGNVEMYFTHTCRDTHVHVHVRRKVQQSYLN